MRGESTTARANALWGDQYALGSARSLADRLREIDDVSLKNVNHWLNNRTIGKMTLVYLGPNQIELDQALLNLD